MILIVDCDGDGGDDYYDDGDDYDYGNVCYCGGCYDDFNCYCYC